MSTRALSIWIHLLYCSSRWSISHYYSETPFNPPRVWLEAKKRISVLNDLDVCLCKRLSRRMSKPCVIVGTTKKREICWSHCFLFNGGTFLLLFEVVPKDDDDGSRAKSFAFHKQWALQGKNLRVEIICCETLSSSL